MRLLNLTLLLAAFLLASGLAAHAAPPNVVIILGDDQGWTDFGFMGHRVIQTPRLDRLASESLLFTRGYVPSSLCRPSLASLVTGLYAHQHKITSNDPPKELPREQFLAQRLQQIAYIDKVPTLPRMLGQQGYVSLETGKWWEGDPRRAGFTQGMTHGAPSQGGRHGDEGLKIGRQGMQPIFDFIDQAKARPFFVWYAPMMPHQPHTPPQWLLDKYRDKTDSLYVAKYWAMCEWFDETCGELLDYLDRKNLAKNTIVVFLVDNGWIQQPHADRFAPKSKQSPYDGGLRTPIMIRWPGQIEPRRDETTLAISIDLAPTILTASGLKPTSQMQGVNLLDAEALSRREAIFGETFLHNAVDIHDPASSLWYRWGIHGWSKLLVPNRKNAGTSEVELYDLKSDPREEKNLAAEQPERVGQLRSLVDEWWEGE